MVLKYLLFILTLSSFFSFSVASEKVLSCKMNYGISGENDETDIEFKNLSIIDQTQTFFLDLEKNWLSVKSQKDFKENGNDVSKIDFKVSDSIIFSISYLEANGLIVKKNVIELDRYSGFVKHEFRTSNETIYRTGYCKISKNSKIF
tara:strand:+ start:66 stop:506 length:441 start_codon:yes stop_codon:yes gene_type:complete